MAEAEHDIENLTAAGGGGGWIQIYKNLLSTYSAPDSALGAGVVNVRAHGHVSITVEGCTHSQGMCWRQGEDEKCCGRMNWSGDLSRAGWVPKSLHFCRAPRVHEGPRAASEWRGSAGNLSDPGLLLPTISPPL